MIKDRIRSDPACQAMSNKSHCGGSHEPFVHIAHRKCAEAEVCETGMNFPLLEEKIGPGSHIVGVGLSEAMTRRWFSGAAASLACLMAFLHSGATVAGHSGPRREAGKLLAVAEMFEQSCGHLGQVDEHALNARLAELGIDVPDYRTDAGLSDYTAEYVREYTGFIEKNSAREFCEAALAAFADTKPRFLKRLD